MNYSILLVSADREMAHFLRRSLRDTPVKVGLEAGTPKAATDALATGTYDLVVLDMFLPESSGLDMLKSLKRVKEDCSFVLLTRMRTRGVMERSFRYGAQDVLPYPVSTDVLRDTILHRLQAAPILDGDDGAGKMRAAKK